MKKSIFAGLLIFLIQQSLLAGDGDYAISKIPYNLLKHANAVIRLNEEHVELKNLEKMVSRTHFVITILNAKADGMAALSEYYDKFTSIESIEGTLYNAAGIEIKSLKKKDILDLSITEDNLAIDGRVKSHNFYYKVYPYTIEYYVETTKKETMFFPRWNPVTDENISVEKSNMSITVPVDYNLRYKAYNYNREPVVITKEKTKEFSWELQNYEAIVGESFSPSIDKITPFLLLAPSDFIIEDYEGKMTDWKELGLFQVSLNKGRDVLPDPIKQKVHDLINGASTEKEKVYRLYKYLQANTRYISVQLGVGGWRPFEASYVGSKGYGDCKALSNYMHSLLKEAGITSYYTLIKAGNNADDIEVNFPSRQFNHAIVCVPNAQDTIWLECTSQSVAPGYMGRFTGNRHALLITDEGGKLVSTPRYKMNDNVETRNIKAVLTDEGTLGLSAETKYTGLQQEEIQNMISVLSKDKIKEMLLSELDLGTYDVTQFNYKQENNVLPSIDESLKIEISNYATITGKRLFLIPNIMTRSGRKLTTDETRKYDIELHYEYKDVDSVEIDLPTGYSPESVPQPVSVASKFGNYSCSVKLESNKLFYYRKMEHFAGNYPASDYNDLVKFYETVYKSDRNKVVLVKAE